MDQVKATEKTVGTGKPLESLDKTGLDFGEAIKALKQGKRITRQGWKEDGHNLFVFMQVPSSVPAHIVPNMSSLPQSVKNEYQRRFDAMPQEQRKDADIRYRNQLCVVMGDMTTYSWTPSVHDVLEEDWIILD